MLEHILSLAPFSEDPHAISRVADIVQEMKELSTPVHQLKQLDELSTLSIDHPDRSAFHALIDGSAKHIIEQFEHYPPEKSRQIDSLSNVWSAVNAWDRTRTPFTEKLCVKVLDSFRGDGRYQLVRAFNVARSSNVPFDEALLAVNYEATLSVAA